jgi:hypothetical protein
MAQANFDTTETLDITCREGDTFSMTITLKDSSGTGLTLVNDNYEFYMQVKKIASTGARRGSRRTETIVLQTPTIAVNEKSDALLFESPVKDNSGNVTIEASAEVMTAIEPGSYLYDLKYIKPSSTGLDTHKGVLTGTFTVNSQVTNIF